MGLLQFPPKINRYDIATGRTERGGRLAIADPAGLMAVNNIVLTPDGKSYAYTFWRALGAALRGPRPQVTARPATPA